MRKRFFVVGGDCFLTQRSLVYKTRGQETCSPSASPSESKALYSIVLQSHKYFFISQDTGVGFKQFSV